MKTLTEIQIRGDKRNGEWLVVKSDSEGTEIEVLRSWVGDRGGDVQGALHCTVRVPTEALKKALHGSVGSDAEKPRIPIPERETVFAEIKAKRAPTSKHALLTRVSRICWVSPYPPCSERSEAHRQQFLSAHGACGG